MTGTGALASANLYVGSGGTLDVSGVAFTLGNGQNLEGKGAVNGSVNAASGSGIYRRHGWNLWHETFNNNLTLASGAAVYFDLGASATGPNDQIVVNGNLTFNGNVIHLKAPSTAAILDMASDYTLFSSPNLITVASTPTIVWDVPPATPPNTSWWWRAIPFGFTMWPVRGRSSFRLPPCRTRPMTTKTF